VAATEANNTTGIANATASIGADRGRILQNDAAADAQLYQIPMPNQQTKFGNLLSHTGEGGGFGRGAFSPLGGGR
jgi:hypothetical protein